MALSNYNFNQNNMLKMASFKKFEINHSIKNIPKSSNENYKENLIDKTEHILRRMRWKAKFFEEENDVAT